MVLEKECEEKRRMDAEHGMEIKIIKRERNEQMDSLAKIMIDNEKLKVKFALKSTALLLQIIDANAKYRTKLGLCKSSWKSRRKRLGYTLNQMRLQCKRLRVLQTSTSFFRNQSSQSSLQELMEWERNC